MMKRILLASVICSAVARAAYSGTEYSGK
ncbi:MAG: hypothetical protein JWO45_986, partial [Spartobacteria bacterium]|nr:hypothetical protein [Spartobacteria bacterium]